MGWGERNMIHKPLCFVIGTRTYCWWFRIPAITTWDVWNPANHGGYLPYQPVQDFWTINSSSWRIDGWKTLLSFWVSAYFQGQPGSFREGTCLVSRSFYKNFTCHWREVLAKFIWIYLGQKISRPNCWSPSVFRLLDVVVQYGCVEFGPLPSQNEQKNCTPRNNTVDGRIPAPVEIYKTM